MAKGTIEEKPASTANSISTKPSVAPSTAPTGAASGMKPTVGSPMGVSNSGKEAPRAGMSSTGSSAPTGTASGGISPRPAGNDTRYADPKAGEMDSKGKKAALERAMGQIEKAYGKGSIMTLDGEHTPQIPAISTGAISLDLALGGRGLPRGRVVEIFGPESSGKTTLALTVIANAQRAGGTAAFIDAEHALDPNWAKKLGVNLDEMLVSQPDTGEQALEICELLVRSNAIDVIVVDSVAALIPKAEIEGEMGDSHVGLQARLMSQALRKLTGAISKSETIVIFINQLREKIGVMFGSPETTTGGRALKFYSSVRIDIRRIGAIKDGEANVGNRVRAKVVKNKIAPPFREAEFDIMFDEGISVSGDLLDLAAAESVIEKSGAWFSYGGTRLGQGRENAKLFLRQNPDLFAEIRANVLKKRLANPSAPTKAAPAAGAAAGDDD
jgi:recombination protein RecA